MIGLNEAKLRERGFTQDQITEIFQGIEENVNIGFYLEPYYSGLQMHEIRLGLLDNLDVSIYCKPDYDWFQMEELRKGLKAGVDTSLYEDPAIPFRKMREMRRGLQIGHDLTPYLTYHADVIREFRKALENKIDLSPYLEQGYHAEQLEQIRLALTDNLYIYPYLKLTYSGAALQEIRRGLLAGIDVDMYADRYLDWRKMREIRLGLIHQLHTRFYSSPNYSWQQMHEIRLGLMQGLDVTTYNTFTYPATEMRRVRLKQLEALKKAAAEQRAKETIKEEDYSITFSEHSVTATISFWGDRTYLTKQSILDLLARNNISYGIKDDAIDILLDKEIAQIPELIIAKGIAPKHGENGWFEFFFRTNVSRTPKILEDGSADYLNLEWFESVKEGQKIATYHEATEGTDGVSVFGEEIKARNGLEQKVLIGNGFEMSEDKKTYYASVSGIITLNDNRMNINKLLRVDEVSLTTGNLRYDGSVQILGDVENGMIIEVGEDLIIDGNVGAADITCGGNVILKKGMNAGGRGKLKAKGNIESRYFEATSVEADGDIRFNTALNCNLYARGTILSHTALAGGRYSSESGMRLRDVGNKAWIKTILDVVQDAELRAYYDRTKEQEKNTVKELETLKQHRTELSRKSSSDAPINAEVYRKLEDAIYTKQWQLTDLRKNLAKCMTLIQQAQLSKVIISGQAFKGVVVSAGSFHWAADNNMGVTISPWDEKITL